MSTTTGAITGAVGLGVGSVKWVAGKSYDAGTGVINTTRAVVSKVPVPTLKKKPKKEWTGRCCWIHYLPIAFTHTRRPTWFCVTVRKSLKYKCGYLMFILLHSSFCRHSSVDWRFFSQIYFRIIKNYILLQLRNELFEVRSDVVV